MERRTLGIIALSIGALALVVVGAYQLFLHNIDASGSWVTTHHPGSGHDAPPVHETAHPQEVPILAEALDAMTLEDDQWERFPRDETSNRWLEHHDGELESGGEKAFMSRDQAIDLSIAER